MSLLLDALGHLIAAGLGVAPGEQDATPAVALSEATLEPDGIRLVVRQQTPELQGDWVLRGRIEGEHGGRQRLQLTCEQCPEVLPESIAAFRALLETARVTVELDFRGEPATA